MLFLISISFFSLFSFSGEVTEVTEVTEVNMMSPEPLGPVTEFYSPNDKNKEKPWKGTDWLYKNRALGVQYRMADSQLNPRDPMEAEARNVLRRHFFLKSKRPKGNACAIQYDSDVCMKKRANQGLALDQSACGMILSYCTSPTSDNIYSATKVKLEYKSDVSVRRAKREAQAAALKQQKALEKKPSFVERLKNFL